MFKQNREFFVNTLNKNSKFLYYLPIFVILLLVFLLNILQYPMTDEWDQISDPAISEGSYYIISR